MLQRLKISFKKDLNRIDFLINQVLCFLGFGLNGIFLFFSFLGVFSARQQISQLEFLLSIPILSFSAILAFYLMTLSISNIHGRFTNLQIENKLIAWLLYIALGFFIFTSILKYAIYILPPGFFNKNFFQKEKS